MGAKRTLRNKLIANTRTTSQRKRTPHRRVTMTPVDLGEHRLIHAYHTTKGRVAWYLDTPGGLARLSGR